MEKSKLTQIEIARSGKISPEVRAAARREGVDPKAIRAGVAEGTIVVLKNRLRRGLTPLAIGRGLMADPRLMLIDEMSLGLAPIVIDEIFKALKKIKERGITIFFVEQNVKRTLQEADRAYILETGRVALSGAAAELRENDQVKKAYFGVEVCT